MGAYSQLFLQAKSLFRRRPELTDDEAAEALGVKPAIDVRGVETIAAARNDVLAEKSERIVHNQGRDV